MNKGNIKPLEVVMYYHEYADVFVQIGGGLQMRLTVLCRLLKTSLFEISKFPSVKDTQCTLLQQRRAPRKRWQISTALIQASYHPARVLLSTKFGEHIS